MLRVPGIICAVFLFAIAPAAAPMAAKADGHRSDMGQRITQLIEALGGAQDCAAVDAALDLAPSVLYGGARPLPTPDNPGGTPAPGGEGIAEATEKADRIISERERTLAHALAQLANGGRCGELAGDALDLKLFFEEMNEVALAIGTLTRNCRAGDSLEDGDCAQLTPRLNEENGHLFGPGEGPKTIKPGFRAKVRGPFLPRWMRHWEEDVKATPALNAGQCVSIFKETKGLMLELVFDGFTVIADPWATPELVRGTKVPIWRLQWVPSEYVKAFNICNKEGQIMPITVHQRIKQDIGLNWF